MTTPKRHARCCRCVITNQQYKYCPRCGEELDWPPTKAQELAAKAAQIKHERRMLTDPKYAAEYEAQQKMVRANYEHLLKQYAQEGDIFAGLAGVPV